VITALYELLSTLIRLYIWALILAAVVSTLISFNVLDSRNRFVWTIADFLYRVTEPALRPIRRYIPNFGGIDISPLILIIVLQIIASELLPRLFAAIETGDWNQLIF
jgi:YggT family protein